MGPFEAFRLYRLLNKAQAALGKVRLLNMTGLKSKAGFALVLICAALRAAEAGGYCQGCVALADAIGTLGGGVLGYGIADKLQRLLRGETK